MSKFLSCDRAYALQYHHSIIADIPTRFEHKREARLQPLNCFPGSVFHETVQSALMTYRDTGAFPRDLFAVALEHTREYISFSKEWLADVRAHPILGGIHPYWPNHDYAQPVESFYYEGDFPKGYRTAAKEKLIRWLKRFTVLLPDLPFMKVDPGCWLFPSEVSKKVPWFVHNDDFAVYAAFDFLTKEDDVVTIYDWKTGKRQYGESDVSEQLMTYAAYAVEQWNVDPESISLYAVWVDDGSVQSVDCDVFELGRMRQIWEKNQHEWSDRLAKVNGDPHKLYELFPMTEDRRVCARCAFRSCPGRDRSPAQAAKLEPEIEFWDE